MGQVNQAMANPSEEVAQINRLPMEVLEMVFHLLPPRDLKAVVLVCRWWREVGEAPKLWPWITSITASEHDIGRMPEVVNFRRLQAVKTISMWEVSDELLQAVVGHPGLKVMQVWNTSLSTANPALLAWAVAKMEDVIIADSQSDSDQWRYTDLTPQQLTAIFTALSVSSNIKKLDLTGNDLSSVDAELLARPFTQLEVVDLENTQLTPQQVRAIFTAMTGNSKLRALFLKNNDISSVDADILAQTVTQLECIDLGNSCLTPHQVETIFAAISSSSNLKTLLLCLKGNNLSSVDPDVLARAVNKLRLLMTAS